MKRFCFILLVLVVRSVTGLSAENPGLSLFTDRDIYVSGETLLAKIYLPADDLSRIVYLDLVNEQGTRISGVSLEIKKNQADGYLQLPDSLSSGSYLVRAYQKHNARQLKIIREIWISNRFDGLEKTNQMNRVNCLSVVQEKNTDQIKIGNLNSNYLIGSEIHAVVEIHHDFLGAIDGDLLVSVAQADPSFVSATFFEKSDLAKFGLIEKKGIVISGTVLNRKTTKPVSGITVYFIVPDSIPGFQYYQTQADGRFYFMLNKYCGSIDAFVECFREVPTEPLKIKLDELYAESGVLPQYNKHPITEELKNSILRNIDAVTFQKVFNQPKLKLLDTRKKTLDSYPYYGEVSCTVDPQLFIDLPDFTEVSRELLHGVKFRNYNNEPTMQVFNSPMRNYFDEMPLVLLDGIPIRDLNIIKGMGSTDIDRVDICLNERFYGNLRFPGVVAIYSTKKDYSRLTESDQLIHLKFETVQVPYSLEAPENIDSNIPDLRQVIYWNPTVTKNSKILVDCKASSVTGLYKLMIKGRLTDGTLISTEKQFEVK